MKTWHKDYITPALLAVIIYLMNTLIDGQFELLVATTTNLETGKHNSYLIQAVTRRVTHLERDRKNPIRKMSVNKHYQPAKELSVTSGV